MHIFIVIHGCTFILQFAKGEVVWLMKGHNITVSVVVAGVVGTNLFHGANIQDGVYKVEVCGVMLPNTPLPFPNHNDKLA
jgi:hypothetical protein